MYKQWTTSIISILFSHAASRRAALVYNGLNTGIGGGGGGAQWCSGNTLAFEVGGWNPEH